MTLVSTAAKSAGGGTSAMTRIGSVTNVGTAAFDQSGIPGTFTDLLIRILYRTASAGASENLLLNLNGDAGGNYYREKIEARSTTNAASESLGGTSLLLGEGVGNGATANFFGVMDILIPSYSGTSAVKAIQAQIFSPETVGSGSSVITICSGIWNSTAAVTRFAIQGTSNGMIVGSTCRWYGIT